MAAVPHLTLRQIFSQTRETIGEVLATAGRSLTPEVPLPEETTLIEEVLRVRARNFNADRAVAAMIYYNNNRITNETDVKIVTHPSFYDVMAKFTDPEDAYKYILNYDINQNKLPEVAEDIVASYMDPAEAYVYNLIVHNPSLAKRAEKATGRQVLIKAAQMGELEIVKRLLKLPLYYFNALTTNAVPEYSEISNTFKLAINQACLNGHVEVAKYLDKIYRNNAYKGKIFEPFQYEYYAHFLDIIPETSEAGHISVLEWLMKQPYTDEYKPSSERKYPIATNQRRFQDVPGSEDVLLMIKSAIKAGHVKIVKWGLTLCEVSSVEIIYCLKLVEDYNRKDMIELFININTIKYVLDIAHRKGWVEHVHELLLNSSSIGLNIALKAFTYEGHVRVINRLIRSGADGWNEMMIGAALSNRIGLVMQAAKLGGNAWNEVSMIAFEMSKPDLLILALDRGAIKLPIYTIYIQRLSKIYKQFMDDSRTRNNAIFALIPEVLTEVIDV